MFPSTTSRRIWLGVLGLLSFGVIMPGAAWGDPPGLRNTRVHVNFHVQMSTLPRVPPPTAPWYAYFPADPRILPSPQVSPYPSWPMQFPPVAPPPTKMGATPGVGPMLTRNWSAYDGVQAVGYVPAQAPSYWYQGR